MGNVRSVVGERFDIEGHVGSGRMGDVYRARDRVTGEIVALKVLGDVGDEVSQRFLREVEPLGAIHHPGIVRYVAHGTDAGRPFVAMEWIEGKDLGSFARGRQLPANDVRALALRLADALAYLHHHGLTHRDIKPANILLPGGKLADAKLVDFGVTRGAGSLDVATRGQAAGTAAYIAPEQLRDEPVDGRADVFALGCVLYECLFGAPAFQGANVMATLTRILLESPVPISVVRADVPASFANLIARTLSKARSGRPADGDALRAELLDLDLGLSTRIASHAELSREERQLSSVVVARFELAARPDLAAIATRHHGEVLKGMPCTIVVAFPVAADAGSVVSAARFALEARCLSGVTSVTLATAHDEPSGLGLAVERAASSSASVLATGVIIDDVSALLLPSRFEIVRCEAYRELRRERDALDVPRAMFGREPPFRDRQVELDAVIAHALEHLRGGIAGSLILVGPTGQGKSRLRQEALRLLATELPNLSVLGARGDPERTTAPLDLVASLVTRAVEHEGVADGSPQRRLVARIERTSSPAQARRIAKHLGAMVGPAWMDAKTDGAPADRTDVHVLARHAFVDFIVAEATARPTLLVLEDLHWADPPSLALFAEALHACADKPLLLWAIGQPVVRDRVSAWPSGSLRLTIELPELPKSASEAVAKTILGDRATDVEIAALVESALSVPLFVEEAALGVAEGIDADMSRPLSTLVEARLLAEPVDVRRIARAAALVGSVFWRGAVQALVPDVCRRALDTGLGSLEARGWIIEHGSSRFQGDREFSFRHEGMREAAEARSTEEDRVLGHAVMGRWLETAGEVDPGYIASHYARAGLGHAAAEHFARSAELSLAAGDAASAMERIRRGLSCAMDPRVVGWLHLLETRAALMNGASRDAVAHGRAAMNTFASLAGGRDDRWFEAAVATAEAAAATRDLHVALEVADAVNKTLSERDPPTDHIAQIEGVARSLAGSGLTEEAAPLRAWLETVAPSTGGNAALPNVTRSSRPGATWVDAPNGAMRAAHSITSRTGPH